MNISLASNSKISEDSTLETKTVLLSKSDSLEIRLKKHTKEDTVKIQILRELCQEYIDIDNEKLEKHATQMLQVSTQINHTIGKADALNFLGIVEDINSHYAEALNYYSKSLELAKQSNSTKTIASINNNIGLIEWKIGNQKEALSSFFEALEQAEKIDLIKLQANISSNIGLVFIDLKRYEEALSWQKKALALRLKINNDYGLASTYTNLAAAYSCLSQVDSSIYYQKKAISLQQKIEDDYGLGISYLNLGQEYSSLKNFPEAIKYYSLSKDIRENYNDSLGLSYSYMHIASTYKEMGNFRDAIIYGEKALSISKNIKSDVRIAINSKELSDIYSKSGQLGKAIDLLQQYIIYHEKVFNQDMNEKVSELNIKYESEKKEKELLNANLLFTKSELNSRQKNIWLILLASLGVIGIGVFRNFRIQSISKQKQLYLENELLQEQTITKIQEQRLEISRDLHDSLGAQLTFINSVLDNLKSKKSFLNDEIYKKINTLSNFSENAVTELKNTLWILHSDIIHLEDIRLKMLNFINNAADAKEEIQFKFKFDIKNNVQIDSKFSANLLRVFQEIINNALKYSQASIINIEILQIDNNLQMNIIDNGIGFDLEVQQNKSYGLTNIQNRIISLNGTIEIDTKPGKGTNFIIKITL